MTQTTKRLSVRLSIVGIVLALGAATIAYSLMGEDQPEAKKAAGKDVAKQASQPKPDSVPQPIPAADQESEVAVGTYEAPAETPPAEPDALRTVSHEEEDQDVPSVYGAGGPTTSSSTSSNDPPSDPLGNTTASSTGTSVPPDPTSMADRVNASMSDPPETFPTPAGPSPPKDTTPAVAETTDATDSNSTSAALSPSMASRFAADPASASQRAPTATGLATAAEPSPAPPPTGVAVLTPEDRPLATSLPSSADPNEASSLGASFPIAARDAASSSGGSPRSGFSVADSLARPSAPAAAAGAAIGAAASRALMQSSPGHAPPSTALTNSDNSTALPSQPSPTQPAPASSRNSTFQANPTPPATSFSSTQLTTPGPRPVSGAGTTMGPSATSGAQPPALPQGETMATDVPGDRQLEGQQAPNIAVEKTVPEEIQVNRKAAFRILLRNLGNVPAHQVTVVDRVPRGTEFVSATPPASRTDDGLLVWQIGTIQPGQEASIVLEVLPKMEGEIGSVAQVTFQTRASARAICTRPQLTIQHTGPAQVLIGRAATLNITISNTGSGAATNVVLEEDVPEGFTHAAGRELEQAIGTLRPGETVRLSLQLEAAKAGVYQNKLTVRGDGDLAAEDSKPIEVIAPKLQLALRGPSRRYLDRQASYVIQIANPGTAPARSIEIVTYLPKGMKYATSDSQGQYDPQTHAVYWSLDELPAGKQGEVHVTVLPIEPGDQKLRVEGKAALGLSQTLEHKVQVEGIAELRFTLTDAADPIEVGAETMYEVRVRNHGSKADTNIQLAAEMPQGIEPTTGDGPSRATVQGQRVVFAPLARLAPDEEVVFRIHARGKVAGNHVVRVQLQSTELSTPVGKEESTRIYADK